MNKKIIVELIIKKLTADLDIYFRAASSASDEATDEHNKPEGKYDTRGLEASYLAHGQSKQALQTKADIDAFENLVVFPHEKTHPIDVGTLVELNFQGESIHYFLGPSAGGTEIEFEDIEVSVVTPFSPLGKVLMGKKINESFSMGLGNEIRDYKVAKIF